MTGSAKGCGTQLRKSVRDRQTALKAKVVLPLAVSLILWASAFPGIRVGLEVYSPEHLAALRFLVASTALAIYAAITRIRLPALIDLPAVFLAGGAGITVYHLLLNIGELSVSAGAASFVISTVPIFTAILAAVFLNDRLPAVGWLGIGLSLFGVGLLTAGDSRGMVIDPRVFLILISAMGGAVYIVLQKRYLKKYSPLEFISYTIWAGTLLLLVFSRGLIEAVQFAPFRATAIVFYLGLFPAAISYVMWARVLAEWSASKAATALFLVPILSLVISWVWLSEVPNVFGVVGGVLTLTGVRLVRKSGSEAHVCNRSMRVHDHIESGA
ncbi:DMT family transporter [Gemmatimonadota bacterium]